MKQLSTMNREEFTVTQPALRCVLLVFAVLAPGMGILLCCFHARCMVFVPLMALPVTFPALKTALKRIRAELKSRSINALNCGCL